MNKIKIVNYWNNFYKKKHLISPSNFAKHVFKIKKKEIENIYEIGCGNGRDTIFFNKNKINCIGIDNSKIIIKYNKKKFFKLKKNFIYFDFCDFFRKKIKKKFSIYSRFTWHTIDYKQEKRLLNNLSKQKNLNYLFIETRTIKDELYGRGKRVGKHEYLSTHYRRFIDPKLIKEKLLKNFSILFFKQGRNLAKFKKENPWVLRIIAKKK